MADCSTNTAIGSSSALIAPWVRACVWRQWRYRDQGQRPRDIRHCQYQWPCDGGFACWCTELRMKAAWRPLSARHRDGGGGGEAGRHVDPEIHRASWFLSSSSRRHVNETWL